MQIVAKKSFIFTTILLPILMVALVAILPAFLANVKSDEKKNVAIIDNNPGAVYAAAIQDTEDYHFIKVNQSIEGTELYSYFQNEKEGQGPIRPSTLHSNATSRMRFVRCLSRNAFSRMASTVLPTSSTDARSASLRRA